MGFPVQLYEYVLGDLIPFLSLSIPDPEPPERPGVDPVLIALLKLAHGAPCNDLVRLS